VKGLDAPQDYDLSSLIQNIMSSKTSDLSKKQQIKNNIMAKGLFKGPPVENPNSFIQSIQPGNLGLQVDEELKNRIILERIFFLNMKMDLIFRWSKVLDINIYWIRKQFLGSRSLDIIKAFSICSTNEKAFLTFLNIYNFFAHINLDIPYEKIEAALLKTF
jgi:hypothetical protein